MEPILIDTSVWIDFFNGKKNKETTIVKEYIEKDYPFFVCPIIIQEILQGIKEEDDFQNVKEQLLNLDILIIDQLECSIGAAELYRTLRKKGLTIRKSNDCVIAYYSIYFGIQLLHSDKDFDKISKHTALEVR